MGKQGDGDNLGLVLIGVSVLVALGIGGLLFWSLRAPEACCGGPELVHHHPDESPGEDLAPSPARPAPDNAAGPAAALAPGAPTGQPIQRISREVRAELLANIVGRLAAAAAAPPSAPDAPPPSSAVGSLPKEYIQEQIRELVPLIKECYELARDESPDLEGTLEVHFTVVGDPELGSVVEDSQILDSSSAGHNAVLAECVQETMYGLKMRAPEGGGRLSVTYPFRFHTGE